MTYSSPMDGRKFDAGQQDDNSDHGQDDGQRVEDTSTHIPVPLAGSQGIIPQSKAAPSTLSRAACMAMGRRITGATCSRRRLLAARVGREDVLKRAFQVASMSWRWPRKAGSPPLWATASRASKAGCGARNNLCPSAYNPQWQFSAT
jgi:hypothetical protein